MPYPPSKLQAVSLPAEDLMTTLDEKTAGQALSSDIVQAIQEAADARVKHSKQQAFAYWLRLRDTELALDALRLEKTGELEAEREAHRRVLTAFLEALVDLHEVMHELVAVDGAHEVFDEIVKRAFQKHNIQVPPALQGKLAPRPSW